MVRKKVDNRIRVLIENGVKLGHRSLFVVVGKKARDQVVILHHMLSKAEVKARPSVLWCYKKELGFSSHRKKRMKHLQHRKQCGTLVDKQEDDPFDLFVTSTKIRYCYYSETHKILGNTYGMCVLQDFEALTPNLMARTIETVEGGGLVVFLLTSVTSLKQLYTLTMDVHVRFRTEAHQTVVPRFNERFLLSLVDCKGCLFINDQLDVLPITAHTLNIEPVEAAQEFSNAEELNDLKQQLDNKIAENLVGCCRTLDQAKAVISFVDAILEKSSRPTVSLTASRGRGKSAALGLAVSAAISYGYKNIFVTSPSPENLNTFFEFVSKGLEALEFQPRTDFTSVTSGDAELHKAVVRVEVFRHQRQIVQYISPSDSEKLALADLVVIDEAAAIPLPHIKALLGPYLVFLASTVNGYEGTGRSLTLKLFQQLRVETAANEKCKNRKTSAADGSKPRTLNEVTLDEPIRYKAGDKVEEWLTKLLCLDALPPSVVLDGSSSKKERSSIVVPPPEDCKLYYINRDTLFCHHKDSEDFLKQIVGICVASHYKYSPNDLQTMSDAPAHNLFCLMGPLKPKTQPKVLVVIEVALEGEISQESATEGLTKPKKSLGGDLIPWTVSQQFMDPEFARLAGGRIVQIATHPELQGKGYGTRALELLRDYYEFKIPTRNLEVAEEMEVVSEIQAVKERIEPRQNLPPLMLKLDQRRPEKLHYLGAHFGLTENLLKFFKNSDFLPLYLKNTPSDITGEHSCIMLKILNDSGPEEDDWLAHYWQEFRRRFVTLLEFEFGKLPLTLAFYLLMNETRIVKSQEITRDVLNMHGITSARKFIVRRQLPKIAKLYFLNKLGANFQLLSVESAILLGKALQHKTEEDLAKELDIPQIVVTNKLNEAIGKIVKYLETVITDEDQLSDNELISEEDGEAEDEQQENDEEIDGKIIAEVEDFDTSEFKKRKKRKSKKSSQIVLELVENKKIAKLIKNGILMGHRTLFAVVGSQNKYQVANLHRMFTKASGNSDSPVLWCHNSNELELGTSLSKIVNRNIATDDPLERFLLDTKIQRCRYEDLSKNKISTETYAMCVLEDFPALTPSLLVRTTETVQGGGLIVILFNSVQSLKDLYTLDMNFHAIFKTEAEFRFNRRFILSLGAHKRCLIVDDSLNVLPLTYRNLHAQSGESPEDSVESQREAELEEKIKQYQGSDSIKNIVSLCKTSDQCTALVKMIAGITEKSQKSTVSLCGPRGRGKTAILGLGVAAAVDLGYSNIFVASANPESLRTFFKFVLKGFDALSYEKNKHYEVIYSKNSQLNDEIVRINVKEHRRTINYIHLTDSHMLFQAELLIIDEAASIPLDLVKSLLGPYSTFLAFTTSGCESAGRSVVFKLEQELRQRALPAGTNTNLVNKKDFCAAVSGRTLEEVTLTEPVRYRNKDGIEQWLSDLLCLSPVEPIRSGCPLPDSCDLYYVNRDTLFSYHKASEDFLRQLEAVYAASSYKNIPDDLQILCDAPDHHLFCLMGPIVSHKKSLPGILVALEICLEGEIPAISTILKKPERPSHDLIPWTVTREYKNLQFSKLSGARILKIATHPDYQGMGYGSKALRILRDYYEMKIVNLDDVDQDQDFAKIDVQDVEKNNANLPQNGLLNEQIAPEKNLGPLLTKLSQRLPERVDYLGVDFDLSEKMFRFWKKSDFVPVCLKPMRNEVLADTVHICTSLCALNSEENSGQNLWLSNFETQFLDGFITKLSDEFRGFSTALALSILAYKAETSVGSAAKGLTKDELDVHFTTEDMKCLEMYSKNLGDFHLVKVLVPVMAALYFRQKIQLELTNEQLLILLGIGLQHKPVENLSTELDLPPNQIMGLFNRMLRKFYKYLEDIIEADLEKTLMMSSGPSAGINSGDESNKIAPLVQSVERELEQWEELKHHQRGNTNNKKGGGNAISSQLKIENLAQYAIRGTEDEWAKVLATSKGQKNLISVKSDVKRSAESNIDSDLGNVPNKKAKTKTKTNSNKKKNRKK